MVGAVRRGEDRGAVLAQLGDTHDAAGDRSAARSGWRAALTILDELTHPDADDLRRKLHDSM
jgi:hypothetical protein